MQKGKKRTIFEIIDDFYSYLRQFDQVHLSDIRRNVVASPSDRHIIQLIAHIQDRPYLYIKNITPDKVEYRNEKDANDKKVISQNQQVKRLKPKKVNDHKPIYTYTLLKLGVHAREPKVRYVQAPDVIDFIEQKKQELIQKKNTYHANQHRLLIEEYSTFVEEILLKVIEMRDNVAKYVQE